MSVQINELNFLQAQLNLSRFITRAAVIRARGWGFSWYATEDAPSTFEEARAAYEKSMETREPYPVSSLYSDNTIYDRPQTNHAFRFWHDLNHIALNEDFSDNGELAVADFQLLLLKDAGFTRDTMEYRLLLADSAGQTACYSVLKRFPINQKRFVFFAMVHGVLAAIEEEANTVGI